jgi:GNAT superfamily N-acetyltransferase
VTTLHRLDITRTTSVMASTLYSAGWKIASAVEGQPSVDWLVADIAPEDRQRVLAHAFALQVERVLHSGTGHVDHIGNMAYAVWQSIDADRVRRPMPTYDMSLDSACGAAARRFQELDRRLALHRLALPRPVRNRYEHLVVLAVRPTHRGQGLGGRLLRHRLDQCDEQGRPVLAPIATGAVSWLGRFGFSELPDAQTSDPALDSGPDDLLISPLWRPAPQ